MFQFLIETFINCCTFTSYIGEKNDWCFTCEFESLILRMKEGTTPLSPVRILSQIQNIGGNLSNGREEDAHEFLRWVDICVFGV